MSDDELHPVKPVALRRLRADAAWMFSGNVAYAASQWLILVLATKIIPPEEVGRFALALALTAPFMLFANLHLRTIQAADAEGRYRFEDYFQLRMLMVFGALLGIAFVAAAAGYSWRVTALIGIVAVSKAVEGMSDIMHGLLQKHGRLDCVAQSYLLRGPLSAGVVGVVLYLTGSLPLALIGMALVWVAVFVMFDWRLSRRFGDLLPAARLGRPNWRSVRALFATSLPMGVVAMLVSLNPNVPRYFVERILGERELAFYAAAAYVLVAGRTVVSAVGQAAVPRLGRMVRDGSGRGFTGLLLKITGFGVLLGAAGVVIVAVWGEAILTLLYSAEYANTGSLFLWLMVAAGLSYVSGFLWYGIMALRRFQLQVPFYLVAVIICTVGCAVLVPRHGTVGAAMALVIATSFQVAATAGLLVFAMAGAQLRPAAAELTTTLPEG